MVKYLLKKVLEWLLLINLLLKLQGKSGHAGKPQQCIDATIVCAAIVMNLQSIISREIDPLNSAVVTIGTY